MASIGWIDFSPEHRNRVGSVLDLLKPEGMVDELGLGTIRDALANEMFPGISTIQTRAKYFFIIPYLLHDYQSLATKQRKLWNASKFLEEKENEIMWQLATNYNHEEGHGVIGITKRKPNKIVRRPSAIYWNGISTYQFINTKGLAAEGYLKQADRPSLESLLSFSQSGDDITGDDLDVDHNNPFNLRVSPTKDWAKNLTLNLGKEEAEFFKDRIVSLKRKKLIAELLANDELWAAFEEAENFMQFAKKAVTLAIPTEIKDVLVLSHDFSELMYGAHITYNCLTHQKKFNSNYFNSDWEDWLHSIKQNMLAYDSFNPAVLFSYALTSRPKTTSFVIGWWELTQTRFQEIKERDNLVETQEMNVKGRKSRLKANRTEAIIEKKWLGLDYFDYRFKQAKTILRDIRSAL